MPLPVSRRRLLAGGAALVAATYGPRAWPRGSRPTLPIPPMLDGTDGAPLDLRIRTGAWSFRPGERTPTIGVNQDYLGPTIRTRRNSRLNLRYRNMLDEGVAVHGHGLHVPGDVDGGPQLEIPPGEEWRPSLSIVQPAATCWYHSHTHGRTGAQVYRGLAGLIVIDDDLTESGLLPRRYGVDDLPVVIQDRTFDARGRLVYALHDAGEDGWYGDTVVVNGAIAPVARAPAGWVRLRILNGANARFYVVAFADGRVFQKIATDGGLLPAPAPLTLMEMAPGERCEILVDLSDGASADLVALFEDQFDGEEEGPLPDLAAIFARLDAPPAPALTLQVDPSSRAHDAPLPNTLADVARPKPDEIVRTRDFLLAMDHGGHGGNHGGHGAMDMTINGAAMDMAVVNERVPRGVWERWRIRADQGAHPFHIHGCSFLIESMEGAAAPVDQRGWKDVVVVDDDDWSTILVRFDHVATDDAPYMYHCHILEHEDRGMMGQFTVT